MGGLPCEGGQGKTHGCGTVLSFLSLSLLSHVHVSILDVMVTQMNRASVTAETEDNASEG